MSFIKTLLVLVVVAIVIFVVITMVQTLYPNPYTAYIYNLVTVTLPAYIMPRWETVAAGAGIAITTLGAALSKISSIQKQATTAISTAQEQKNQALSFASSATNEVSTLKTQLATTQQELQMKNQQLAEAELAVQESAPMLTQYKTEAASLRTQLDELNAKYIQLAQSKVTEVPVVR